MRSRRSLSSRLIVYWLVGSLLAFFSVPATIHLPLAAIRSGDLAATNLDAWTTRRARSVVSDSLRRSADGRPYIEMTDALQRHLHRNPQFEFAAVDVATGESYAGSFDDLAAYLRGPSTGFDTYGANFRMAGDNSSGFRGVAWTMDTPVGPTKIAVYGADFHWDDVLYQLYYYLRLENLLAYLPLFGVMSMAAVVAMQRGLAPLRAITLKISDIDLNSLNQRVSSNDVPTEIVPIVDAMNAAFARLDEGVARERRFTANAAHELRTPITILNSHVEKMDATPLKLEIQRDVRRIRTIIEQMLVLARLSERRGEANEMLELDLGPIVRDVIADFAPIAFDNGRNIALEAPPGPIIARVHQWGVESVLINLLENAVRAEPRGGMVLVRVTRDAIVEVVDHGAGIEPGEREKIFEPFWRKDDGSVGTGLGLSIVRELLDRMEAVVFVTTTPGGGATFRIEFSASRGAPS